MAKWCITEAGELINLDQAAFIKIHGVNPELAENPRPVEVQAVFAGGPSMVFPIAAFRGEEAGALALQAREKLTRWLKASPLPAISPKSDGKSKSQKRKSSD